MLEAIAKILGRCGTDDPVLPPTTLFNEGWLLRLTLDWLDHHRDADHVLRFASGARWYSEALLPSQFLPQTRGDPRAESFTHADGLIGHFSVRPGARGDATILSNAGQFIVTEAKLGSALSAGTKNAPGYDQAARNVACIAHMLGVAGVDPTTVQNLALYVIAPQQQIDSGVFANLVTKESVEAKVRERIGAYDGAHDRWFEHTFKPVLSRIRLSLLSWESVLEALPDTSETRLIADFYRECLRFNPMRPGRR